MGYKDEELLRLRQKARRDARECQQADNQQKLLGAVRQKRRLHTEPRRQQPRHDA